MTNVLASDYRARIAIIDKQLMTFRETWLDARTDGERLAAMRPMNAALDERFRLMRLRDTAIIYI